MADEGGLEKTLLDLLRQFDVDVGPIEESEEERASLRHGDYSSLINKAEQKLSDLNAREEEILKETNMTRREIEDYAENPDNFTPEQWAALGRFKQQMATFRQETDAALNKASPQAGGKKVLKKRKHRPVPKKGWISL